MWKSESGSSRFQPGEGFSRGLLRDYEHSDGPFWSTTAEADTSHVKQRADSADIVRVTVSIIVQGFMGMKMSNT